MDVIIDTCIVLKAPSMRAGYFENLFAYLRKTNSNLVILAIVFDEAVGKYRGELTSREAKHTDAAGQLNSFVMNPLVPPVEKLDIGVETQRFALLLSAGKRNGESLPIKQLPDYSGIDIREVAARGINRIPPADSNGQQLRDVMVWLAAKSYCKSSGKPVAFIACDKTYFVKDKTQFKPELLEEIAREGALLELFPSIEEFLKSVTTKVKDIDKYWIAKRVSVDQVQRIFEKNAEHIAWALWHGERSVKALNSTFEFRGGKLYDLDDGTKIAEIEVMVKTTLRVSDWPYPPPEAYYPEDEARIVRQHQKPVWSEDYDLNGSLVVTVQLTNDTVTAIAAKQFEYDSAGSQLRPSPVLFPN